MGVSSARRICAPLHVCTYLRLYGLSTPATLSSSRREASAVLKYTLRSANVRRSRACVTCACACVCACTQCAPMCKLDADKCKCRIARLVRRHRQEHHATFKFKHMLFGMVRTVVWRVHGCGHNRRRQGGCESSCRLDFAMCAAIRLITACAVANYKLDVTIVEFNATHSLWIYSANRR